MSQWNPNLKNLTEEEYENILHLYWEMLCAIESDTDPKTDALDRLLVESGHTILRRLKITNSYPRWQEPQPETVAIRKPS